MRRQAALEARAAAEATAEKDVNSKKIQLKQNLTNNKPEKTYLKVRIKYYKKNIYY